MCGSPIVPLCVVPRCVLESRGDVHQLSWRGSPKVAMPGVGPSFRYCHQTDFTRCFLLLSTSWDICCMFLKVCTQLKAFERCYVCFRSPFRAQENATFIFRGLLLIVVSN